MDKRLKQRLVGATVLVAVAVIVVPELVKEPVEQSRPVADTTIPPPPTLEPGQRAENVAIPSGTEETEPAEPLEGQAEIELPDIEMTSTKPSADVVFEQPPEPAVSPVPEDPVELPTAPAVELPPPSPPEKLTEIEQKPGDFPEPRIEEKPSKPPELPRLELIARPGASQTEPSLSASPPPAPPVPQTDWDWMVQAGSFSRQDYADRLRDQLQEQGFPASVKRAVIDGQVYYRVRIGPHPTRSESEETLVRLQRVAGVNGRVVHRSEGW